MRSFDKELSSCPICGSTEIFLYHVDSDGIRINKCRNCNVQFMNPQYSDADLAEYYSHYTFEEPKWDEPLTYGHNFYLSLVENYEPSKGKLLDIGCGKGHLIKVAKERGWTPVGYDVDCDSVKYFSEKHGIQILCGDFLKIDWKESEYDLVVMHHVFEHLKNPIDYLQKISFTLKQNGFLLIVLPNIRGLSSSIKFTLEKLGIRKKNIGAYYDSSHHVFYYEPKTLKNILQNHGYKIHHVRSGHKVRPHQSKMKRYLLRNFYEKIAWKSTFLIIAQKM